MTLTTFNETLIFIQARMGSIRYPGKSLAKLAGRESLGHLLDSLRCIVPSDGIVVLTSNQGEDNPIEQFCRTEGVMVRRGDRDNVASRFLSAVSDLRPKYFVRISGDSPLFDYRILGDLLLLFRQIAANIEHQARSVIVTTTGELPFPSGMNCELIPAELFVRCYQRFCTPDHFEHVTRYFYDCDLARQHSEGFEVVPLGCQIADARRYKFSFDTPEDGERIGRFFSKITRPHYELSLEEKCRIMAQILSG